MRSNSTAGDAPSTNDARIHLLSDALANQIAAGEVVQRPASVVKELLENSVDAGARNVELSIKQAGKSLIQVVDDGCGMSALDAAMSLERHATSKIQSVDDLFELRTLGFRGEALASIAAVAQLCLKTRRLRDELGAEVRAEGGQLVHQGECVTPPGTLIQVRNLFYNVPARRKFLKSPPVETHHIINELIRVALAYPDVGFRFLAEDKEVYHYPAGDFRQRVGQVLQQARPEELMAVEESTELVRIQGWVGAPRLARKKRGDQYLLVNGRYIRSNYLHHAVQSAYQQLLPSGSHPLYVINLELDPRELDINIHPTKTEVKFEDERAVYGLLVSAVRHTLGQFSLGSGAVVTGSSAHAPGQAPGAAPDTSAQAPGDATVSRPTGSTGGQQHAGPDEVNPAEPAGEATLADYRLQRSAQAGGAASSARRWPQAEPQLDRSRPPAKTTRQDWDKLYGPLPGVGRETANRGAPSAESALFSQADPTTDQAPLNWAGQYLVAVLGEQLYVIDPFRARYRVIYERLSHQRGQRALAVQQLLYPQTVEVPAGECELFESLLPELLALGLQIRSVEQGRWLVSGAPAQGQSPDLQGMVDEILEQAREHGGVSALPADTLLQTLARRLARGPRQLPPEQSRLLLRDLLNCRQPQFSPDGKPVYWSLPLRDAQETLGGGG